MAHNTKHDIDLGALQNTFLKAKHAHDSNEKGLKKALDQHRKGKKDLEKAKADLEAASAAVLD